MENVFLSDVLNQPEAIRTAMRNYEGYGALLQRISALQPKSVLFAGMGSSHYCSQSAVIRLNEGGIPARVEAASEILYYEWKAITPDTLLVLTSQSGESGEIVDIIKKLPPAQTVIGITNDPESTLGRRADICLTMHVAPELAVSTRTYLASLVLTDLVASALLGETQADLLAPWKQALQVLAHCLTEHETLQRQIADFLNHPAFICYIGRGHALASAECGALFTRETAKYPALAFDSAEFRHGPFEMVEEGFAAIVFAPGGETDALQRHLAQAIAAHDGRVIFVTDTDARFDTDRILVLKHERVPERYAPIVQVLFAQLFANDMAMYRGHAPGIFRQSSKITTAQ